MPGIVLIVVGSPAHRVMFHRALAETPLHLVFAEDAEDGLRRFRECRPDAVIAHDSRVSEAVAFCQRLRAQHSGDGVPILIASERFETRSLAARAVESALADDDIALPMEADALEARVTRWLAGT